MFLIHQCFNDYWRFKKIRWSARD